MEQYLFRESKGYERFVSNLAALPRTSESVIIRSCFGPYARGLAPKPKTVTAPNCFSPLTN